MLGTACSPPTCLDSLRRSQDGDPWQALQLCLEVEALAKLYSSTGPYSHEAQSPLLIATSH